MLRTLAARDLRYVLIGGLAGTLHGSPIKTADADICPARDVENLERLAATLTDLDARIFAPDRPEGLAFARDAAFLQRNDLLNLVTRFGPLDVSFRPAGFSGYEELAANALVIEVAGVRVPVAALDDVIRSKKTANRAKDRASLPELEALSEEIRHRQR